MIVCFDPVEASEICIPRRLVVPGPALASSTHSGSPDMGANMISLITIFPSSCGSEGATATSSNLMVPVVPVASGTILHRNRTPSLPANSPGRGATHWLYEVDPEYPSVSPTANGNVAPPSEDPSQTTCALNEAERRVQREISPFVTAVRVKTGEVRACATVALTAMTHWGDERGVLVLTAMSSTPGFLALVDNQPAGRCPVKTLSNPSLYGNVAIWASAALSDKAAAMQTKRVLPGRNPPRKTMGKLFDFWGNFRYIALTLLHLPMDQLRILYVDDDPDLRTIVRDQLTLVGYVLDEAEDGAVAIQMLGTGNYDLMLLDINMPRKSGIDVLKIIKDQGLKCKVIMLTGRVGFSVATETLKLGADDYITKPFTIDYLLFSIKRVMGR